MKQPLHFNPFIFCCLCGHSRRQSPQTNHLRKSKKHPTLCLSMPTISVMAIWNVTELKRANPNVNRLAKSGIRFTNAHATAATSSPFPLFHADRRIRMAQKEGTDVAAGNAGMIIRPEQYTMADMFKSVGYATAAVGKWHLGLGDKTGTQDWNAPLPCALGDLGFDYHYHGSHSRPCTLCLYRKRESSQL